MMKHVLSMIAVVAFCATAQAATLSSPSTLSRGGVIRIPPPPSYKMSSPSPSRGGSISVQPRPRSIAPTPRR